MSFHSTQATSHALQPMHVVTSMYLQTCSSRGTPWPGTLPYDWPDRSRICSVPDGTSDLLDLDEEPLELRRVGVRIDDRRRQHVHRVERRLPFVLGDAAVAPVNRNADLIRLPPVDQHRLDALRDHRLGDVRRPRAGDLHAIAAADAEVRRQVV